MHKEIVILISVVVGALIVYSIVKQPPKEKIISAQVKQKEASIQQVDTKPLPFFSNIPDTFNFIRCPDESKLILGRRRWYYD